jgi:hypothetical protein
MATEILRPNAAGDETYILQQYPTSGAHWDKVDEESADEDGTYVEGIDNVFRRDLYNLPAHSGSGTINFIKVYSRSRAGGTPTQASLKIPLKTGGSVYESSEITLTTSYINYSNPWNTNPKTGVAWTWDDIDALQIGVTLRQSSGLWGSKCTQVYVEVDYTAGGGVTEKSSADVGSGVEGTPLPSATLAGSETGAGIEAFIARLLAVVDAGSGADAFVSLQTPAVKSSSDAGSGVEGIPLPSATLAGSDNGAGIEALIFRLLAAAETGYSAEASIIGGGGLLKNLFANELGEGSDTLTAKIEIPASGGGMKLWT